MMQVGFDDAASRYIDAVLDVPELEVTDAMQRINHMS